MESRVDGFGVGGMKKEANASSRVAVVAGWGLRCLFTPFPKSPFGLPKWLCDFPKYAARTSPVVRTAEPGYPFSDYFL